MNSLCVSQLKFRYLQAGPDVLDIPNLTVPRGQFVSLLGASGSGKSTLLRLIAGLLESPIGSVERQAQNVSNGVSGNDIGMVFQSANLIPWRTARQNVVLPAELGLRPTAVSAETLDELFRLVGLSSDDTRKRPAELSGGMQMRVAMARALVLRPSTLMMDEPFAALDDLLRMQLEEDVRRIHNERNLTTVLVTHNIHEAVFMSDRVLVLGGQPSGIASDLQIDLPPNRNSNIRRDAGFHQLVSSVTDALHAAGETVTAATPGATLL